MGWTGKVVRAIGWQREGRTRRERERERERRGRRNRTRAMQRSCKGQIAGLAFHPHKAYADHPNMRRSSEPKVHLLLPQVAHEFQELALHRNITSWSPCTTRLVLIKTALPALLPNRLDGIIIKQRSQFFGLWADGA